MLSRYLGWWMELDLKWGWSENEGCHGWCCCFVVLMRMCIVYIILSSQHELNLNGPIEKWCSDIGVFPFFVTVMGCHGSWWFCWNAKNESWHQRFGCMETSHWTPAIKGSKKQFILVIDINFWSKIVSNPIPYILKPSIFWVSTNYQTSLIYIYSSSSALTHASTFPCTDGTGTFCDRFPCLSRKCRQVIGSHRKYRDSCLQLINPGWAS